MMQNLNINLFRSGESAQTRAFEGNCWLKTLLLQEFPFPGLSRFPFPPDFFLWSQGHVSNYIIWDTG